MQKEVRVRFAPSPTGPLHIGGVRTALYNYLFAKKHGGKFLIRIEDTDQSRYISGAEEYIFQSLEWLGLIPDEGPYSGGPFEPYRQSERKDIYREYAQRLVDEGKAYYAFDSAAEIERMKDRLKGDGVVMPQYNFVTRGSMVNSLTLSDKEVRERLDAGTPYVIRIKIPANEEIRFRDQIRDWVHVSSVTLDDKILLKSDGMPTYHLANVVDDHLMKITHVIRGEEWLPSAPLHVLLYKLLGCEDTMPAFAHLPLILKPEGVGKLSKRDGDKHGFPVFPLEWKDPETGQESEGFREKGYLPETVINFLALLGWNPGSDQEFFSVDELIHVFSLERVNKAGARFDIEKARWLNQQYIKNLPADELGKYLMNDLEKAGIKADKERVERIADAYRERITFPHEIAEKSRYFFYPPEEYDEKIIRKKWNEEVADVLGRYAGRLSAHEGSFTALKAKDMLSEILEEKGMGLGKVMQALRVAVTGESSGVDLMLTIEILGPAEVSERIRSAIETLPSRIRS